MHFYFLSQDQVEKVAQNSSQVKTLIYSLEGKISLPKNYNDFDYISYLAKDQIYTIAYRPSAEVDETLRLGPIETVKVKFFRQIFSFKNKFENAVGASVKEPHASFLNGILLGSRQVGKTTLVEKIFPKADYFLVDNEPIKKILEAYDIDTYKTLINENSKEIIIDEIHLLDNPGRAIKIIYDQLENIKIIITGSSSFHIKNKTGESLAGRKIDYNIYPLTFSEYLNQKGIEKDLNFNIFEKIINDKKYNPKDQLYKFDVKNILNNVLIYGLYPHLIKKDKLTKKGIDYEKIFSKYSQYDLFGKSGEVIDIPWNSYEQKAFAPDGSFSNSSKASPKKGKEYHDYMVNVLVDFISWLKKYKGPIGNIKKL